MRKKLPILLLTIVFLLQAFIPAVYAASKNEVAASSASFCPFDTTSEGAGKTVKTDFYVTPKGDAIPGTKAGLNNNLSMMEIKNGKYYGSSSNGIPTRVRVEGVHPQTNVATHNLNPYHDIPHIHVEYKQNVFSGQWGKGHPNNNITLPQSWFK